MLGQAFTFNVSASAVDILGHPTIAIATASLHHCPHVRLNKVEVFVFAEGRLWTNRHLIKLYKVCAFIAGVGQQMKLHVLAHCLLQFLLTLGQHGDQLVLLCCLCLHLMLQAVNLNESMPLNCT